MKLFILIIACCFTLAQTATEVTRARAYLFKAVKGGAPNQSVGVIDFIQNGNSLSLNGTIEAALGLAPGLHGFHIHEKGDLGDGCLATGAHYNPHKMTHGAPTDSNRHIGDLGNINAPASGNLDIRVADTLASLNGQFSILGRAVVVHEKADDLGKGQSDLSKTTGDAGSRWHRDRRGRICNINCSDCIRRQYQIGLLFVCKFIFLISNHSIQPEIMHGWRRRIKMGLLLLYVMLGLLICIEYQSKDPFSIMRAPEASLPVIRYKNYCVRPNVLRNRVSEFDRIGLILHTSVDYLDEKLVRQVENWAAPVSLSVFLDDPYHEYTCFQRFVCPSPNG
ncbi:unnamed protein product, partial [Mesorhabditis spiculigera]